MKVLTQPKTLLVALCVAAIMSVEIGWRTASPTGMELPVPQHFEPLVEVIRGTLATHIADPEHAAIASGIVFGRTEHVSAPDERAFLDSGLWHLLAASGQNVALVIGMCVVGALSLGRSRRAGMVAALAAVPAYVLLVGGGASIIRAGIMGELAVAAWLAGRLTDKMHVLLVAICAICWLVPGAHRSLGMQLSCACVAGLITWATPWTRWMCERGIPAAVAGGVSATAICSLVTAPILAVATGAAPFTGVLANLVAIPLAAVELMVGISAVPLMLLADWAGWSGVSASIGTLVGAIAGLIQTVAHRAAQLPGATNSSPLITVATPVSILLWLNVRTLVTAYLARLANRLLIVCLSTLVGVGAINTWGGGQLLPRGVRGMHAVEPMSNLARHELGFVALDVGQGDATLIYQDKQSILIDTGPPDGRVVQRVRELGIERIDGLVLTHNSLDHRGGFEDVMTSFNPRWIARPVAAPGPWGVVSASHTQHIDLCAGDSIPLGSAMIDVLHPPCDGRIMPRTDDLHNDGAMVLLVRHGNVRMLVPADAEAPVLNELRLPMLHLLRVSHHGSDDPELAQLLAQTNPTVAVISVGAGNEYGHPRRTTLNTLARAGARVRRTDVDGTVVVRSDGRGIHQ